MILESINKEQYFKYFDGVVNCFAPNITSKFMKNKHSIYKKYFNDCVIDYKQLDLIENVEHKSLLQRMFLSVIYYEICNREISNEMAKEIWNILYYSTISLPKGYILGEIGSQQFVSIPIYKQNLKMQEFEYLKLHIWNNNLSKYTKFRDNSKFKIHSHSFQGYSYILLGQINNTFFDVLDCNEKSEHSLFKLMYENVGDVISKKYSYAVNLGKNVKLSIKEKRQLKTGENYQIEVGQFHSALNDSRFTAATIFSFSAKNGFSREANLIGLSSIEKTELNSKIEVENVDFYMNMINDRME